jgi:hypothetical protein
MPFHAFKRRFDLHDSTIEKFIPNSHAIPLPDLAEVIQGVLMLVESRLESSQWINRML